MGNKTLKDKIKNFIREKGGVSFIELERLFDENGFDYRGNMSLVIKKNCTLWCEWNKQAIDLFSELRSEGMTIQTSDVLIYVIDGAIPDLPVTYEINDYETPHWLPTVFNMKE